MTPKQYAAAIEALGLSQRAAGAFLGVDERTSRRWISGESAIPESVAMLLRLMIRLNLNHEDVTDITSAAIKSDQAKVYGGRWRVP